MPETPEPIGTKKKSKIQIQNFSAEFFFFSKMDLEPPKKASGCFKNPKGEQDPQIWMPAFGTFWVPKW